MQQLIGGRAIDTLWYDQWIKPTGSLAFGNERCEGSQEIGTNIWLTCQQLPKWSTDVANENKKVGNMCWPLSDGQSAANLVRDGHGIHF